MWARVFQQLSRDADNEYAMIDSTIVRAHQHSAGAAKKTAAVKPSGGAGWAEYQDPRHSRRPRQPARLALSQRGRRTIWRGRCAAPATAATILIADEGYDAEARVIEPLDTGRQDGGDPAQGQPQEPPALRQGPLPSTPPDRELFAKPQAIPLPSPPATTKLPGTSWRPCTSPPQRHLVDLTQNPKSRPGAA